MGLIVYPDYTFTLGTARGLVQWQHPPDLRLGGAAIERTRLAQTMQTLLERHGQIVVRGVPGVGKSTLAAAFGRQSIEQYPGGVVWVTVGPHVDPEAGPALVLDSWFTRATDLALLPAGVHVDAAMVRTVWQPAPRMLVILDDVCAAAHIAVLRDALPAHAHLIITTRDDACAADLQLPIVQVDVYDEDEALAAMAVLLEVPVATLRAWAWPAHLAAHLGRYPLAIDQVSRYLANLTLDPAGWAVEAAELCAQSVDAVFPLLLQRPVATGASKSLLIAHIYTALHPLERQVLGSIACTAADQDIPLALLTRAWELSPEAMTGILTRLEQHGLVTAVGDNSWRQHSVLRGCVHAQMAHTDARAQLSQRILWAACRVMEDHTDAYTYGLATAVYGQLQGLFAIAIQLDIPGASDIVSECAPYHRAQGMHQQQLSWANQLAIACAAHASTQYRVNSQMLLADAYVDHAAHVGVGRAQAIAAAATHYHEARIDDATLALHPQRAALFNRRAIAMIEAAELPGADRGAYLADAIASCDAALADPQLDAGLYASICQNKANVLHELGREAFPGGTMYLDNAIQSCLDALAYLPTELTTQHFVGLYGTLASIYRSYAECEAVERSVYLGHARDASGTVLLHLDKDRDPMRYARELMNRANIFGDLAEELDSPHARCIEQAIEHLHEALAYRTEATVPLEYAWTHHNLAVAYRTQSMLVSEDQVACLHKALVSMDAALRYRTADEVPAYAALSHYIAATIYRDLADALDTADPARDQALVEGFAHVDQALALYETLTDAFAVAACYDVRASLGWRQAVLPIVHRASILNRALEDVRRALRSFSPSEEPNDYGESLLTEAQILTLQGRRHEIVWKGLQRAFTCITHQRNAELFCRARLVGGEVLRQRVVTKPVAVQLIRMGAIALDIAQRLDHGPHQRRAYAIVQAAADVLGGDRFGHVWAEITGVPVPVFIRLR